MSLAYIYVVNILCRIRLRSMLVETVNFSSLKRELIVLTGHLVINQRYLLSR